MSAPEAVGALTATPAGARVEPETWVIEPRAPGIFARLREVWRYRHLLVYFTKQNLLEIFREEGLGWLWNIPKAGAPSLLMAFAFGSLLAIPVGDIPPPLFILVGMTVWHAFDFSLIFATRAMKMHAQIVSRMYFPRLILLPASTVESLIRIGILLVLLVGVSLYFLAAEGRWYLRAGPELLAGAAALILAWLLALAFALWTSVLEAPARDVRYGIRYALQFWLFLTPIVYPLSIVPPAWQGLLLLNPLTGVAELFRWGVIGQDPFNLPALVASLAGLLVIGGAGLVYFGRAEAKMVDAL